MNGDWLSGYITGADRRYRAMQLSVTQTVDLALYQSFLQRLQVNPSAQAALASPMFRESVRCSRWDVWLARPYRRKVDYYRPPDRLIEMAGGDETQYWQAFPASRTYYVTDKYEQFPADEAAAPWPYFRSWLPPAVSELIYPAFLWEQPEGYLSDPAVSATGSSTVLGREVIVASLKVTDWETRAVGWSETILPAESYELLIDKETGILLSTRSVSGGRLVSSVTVDKFAVDGTVDPGFFSIRNWIDKDWKAGE
jgi:hypothetical protein